MCTAEETEPNSTSYRKNLVFLLTPVSRQTNSLLCNNMNLSSEDNRVFLKHKFPSLEILPFVFGKLHFPTLGNRFPNMQQHPWADYTSCDAPGSLVSTRGFVCLRLFPQKKKKTTPSSTRSPCDREVKVEPKWNCSKIFLESSASNEQIQVTLFCLQNLGA